MIRDESIGAFSPVLSFLLRFYGRKVSQKGSILKRFRGSYRKSDLFYRKTIVL